MCVTLLHTNCLSHPLSCLAVEKDGRYSIVKLAKREFTVQVSDVSFKDGGIYTCLHYHHKHNSVTTKRVKVTVLGKCKLSSSVHDIVLQWFDDGFIVINILRICYMSNRAKYKHILYFMNSKCYIFGIVLAMYLSHK